MGSAVLFNFALFLPRGNMDLMDTFVQVKCIGVCVYLHSNMPGWHRFCCLEFNLVRAEFYSMATYTMHVYLPFSILKCALCVLRPGSTSELLL